MLWLYNLRDIYFLENYFLCNLLFTAVTEGWPTEVTVLYVKYRYIYNLAYDILSIKASVRASTTIIHLPILVSWKYVMQACVSISGYRIKSRKTKCHFQVCVYQFICLYYTTWRQIYYSLTGENIQRDWSVSSKSCSMNDPNRNEGLIEVLPTHTPVVMLTFLFSVTGTVTHIYFTWYIELNLYFWEFIKTILKVFGDCYLFSCQISKQ